MNAPAIFPALIQSDFAPGARIFATRADLVSGLDIERGGIACEVGVAMGDFSEVILDVLAPARFVAFDLYEMHKWPMHWGRPSKEIFEGKTHEQYYRDRFCDQKQVELVVGMSEHTLPKFESSSFDFIYVDGVHDYEGVSVDANNAARLLKSNGVIVFNDYTMYDTFIGKPYGVVQAVNELVRNGGWKVVGFAMEKNMFCDIAISRCV